MNAVAETIGEMVDVARDIGASLLRLVGGARLPIDSADMSALSDMKTGEGRKPINAPKDCAGNADAR